MQARLKWRSDEEKARGKKMGITDEDRIYHLERGYEHMELKLQSLGARVARWVVPTA